MDCKVHHHGTEVHQRECCCGGDGRHGYLSKKMQIKAMKEKLALMKDQVADLEAYIAEQESI